MWRLVIYLLVVIALATGLAWLADRPGSLIINWQGYDIETSVFRAVVILSLLVGAAIMLFSIARQIWMSPAIVGNLMNRRRQKRGLEAISTGMIAIGAGDRTLASRYALQARKSLPNEPLTHLLRAQAAQLSGDKATARRIFEAMLGSPDTEQLGLRGLFLEAEREGEKEAARQFAERALAINPKLGWPVEALFDLQCKAGDWADALETLSIGRKHGHIDKAMADRRRAVLLTAKAQPLEDSDPEKALALSQEAHGLAPDLVPAAVIAARILASRGSTPKAAKIIQQTWKMSPHPDLATVYAYARIGDSPRDRLTRVKQLTLLYPNSAEGPIAVANTAIEAKDYDEARAALETLREGRLTQRVCLLMARIEGEQHGDKGRVREWLARAVNAPRDPAWTADGVVSEQWQPRSPVTGALDAFQWRVPVELAEKREADVIAEKLEELVALGAPREPIDTSEAKTITMMPVPEAAGSVSVSAQAPPTRKPDIKAEDAFIITERPQPAKVQRQTGQQPAPRSETSDTERGEAPIPAVWAMTGSSAARTEEAAPPPASVKASSDAGANRPRADAQPALNQPAAVAPSANGVASKPEPMAPPRQSSEATAQPMAAAKPAVGVSMPAVAAEAAATRTDQTVPAPAAPSASAPPASLAAKQQTPAGKGKVAAEPRIFVSPRAPDDPGPEPAENDDLRSPLSPYRGP